MWQRCKIELLESDLVSRFHCSSITHNFMKPVYCLCEQFWCCVTQLAPQALELSFNSLLDGLAAAGVVLAFHPRIKSVQNKRADSDGYFGFGHGMTFFIIPDGGCWAYCC